VLTSANPLGRRSPPHSSVADPRRGDNTEGSPCSRQREPGVIAILVKVASLPGHQETTQPRAETPKPEMASPPEQSQPSVASTRTRFALEGQSPHLAGEVAGGDAVSNPAVAVQLIERTTRLSISDPVSEPENNTLPRSTPAGAGQPPYLDAQPHETTAAPVPPQQEDGAVAEPALIMLTSTPWSWPNEGSFARTGAKPDDRRETDTSALRPRCSPRTHLVDLPNEVLFHILSYLDVCDLLATSRVRPVPFLLS